MMQILDDSQGSLVPGLHFPWLPARSKAKAARWVVPRGMDGRLSCVKRDE